MLKSSSEYKKTDVPDFVKLDEKAVGLLTLKTVQTTLNYAYLAALSLETFSYCLSTSEFEMSISLRTANFSIT